jgi:carbamoyl-phosphate synthase large subunit
MEANELHILCTSVGNQGFPSVYRALKQDGSNFVTGIDSDPYAAGIRIADRGQIVSPRSNPDALLDSIASLIQIDRVNCLLPLSTEDQDFYAFYRSNLEDMGYIVVVADSKALEVANDKHALIRRAHELGFGVPRFQFATTRVELDQIVEGYMKVNEACVLKLARGTGAQGVKILDPEVDRSTQFWERTQLRMNPTDAMRWFEEFGVGEPIMVTDYLPGEHLSVDAIRTPEGGFVGCVRLEQRQIFGSAMVAVTVRDDARLEDAKRLSSELGLRGAMNIEFRKDQYGVASLLEVNPRFGASIGHTVLAGLNLPLALVRAFAGIPVRLGDPETGVPYSAMWTNVFDASQFGRGTKSVRF